MVKEYYFDDEDSGSGTGGKSGQVEFRDFLSSNESRENLSPHEKKMLLAAHEATNKASIDKQRERKNSLEAVKANKISLEAFRQEGGQQDAQMSHPLLKDKAQFSGMDNQVDPTQDNGKANDNKRAELKYNHDKQNRKEYTPSNTPRPSPI